MFSILQALIDLFAPKVPERTNERKLTPQEIDRIMAAVRMVPELMRKVDEVCVLLRGQADTIDDLPRLMARSSWRDTDAGS